MKTNSILKLFLLTISLLAFNIGCVHDDDYSTPPVECQDFENTITIADVKAMYNGMTTQITDDVILEGYVSSSDESGNIYKTLYIQDAPENPTHGLTVSLNVTGIYTRFPVGSKVFIKLKDLYLGEYGDVIQLGGLELDETGTNSFGRVSLPQFEDKFFRGCESATIVPLEVDINNFNDDLIGALIQINDAQFSAGVMCTTYAASETTVNKLVEDCSGNQVIVRNSGYSDFFNVVLPAGKGPMRAILSKFGSDYQLFIRGLEDTTDMTEARCDGTTPTCTAPDDNADIQDIKDQYTGTLSQISQDFNVTATVTGNDDTGNLYKVVYIEDNTGGIRLRLNRTNLYLDSKFQIGAQVTVAAKDLYVDSVNGELHLGGLYNGNVGNIEDEDIFKYVFDNQTNSPLSPSTINIQASPNLDAHVGKLVRFDDVEFDDTSKGLPFAGSSDTNRTVKDCSGNTILVRTSRFASFKNQNTPEGKGSLVGILSVYNGTYQIWLRNPNELDMDGVRCDGTVPAATIFSEDFESGLSNWTTVNVLGAQTWSTSNQGASNYYAKMSGYSGGNIANEDWLISPAINLSGLSNAFINVDTDYNYSGNVMETYITTNFTGDVTTTTWTPISIPLDPNSGWGFYNSGNVSLNTYLGQTVYVAFKYTSTTSGASTWEVDNFKVKGN